MASPIFPGVGTQSRIAQVIQNDNDLRLRQEALNRQSGQGLLSTGLQGVLGIGQLTNEAVQAALDREQRGTLADAERAAAIARITATGEQARETQAGLAGLQTTEAQRVEGVDLTERQRVETRGEPGGADFIERVRQEVVRGGQEKDLADIRLRGQLEGGPVAAERLRQENLPEELRQRRESAAEEAATAQEFARDPITFIEDQLVALLETVQVMTRAGQGLRGQAALESQLPGLLELYDFFLQGDPEGAARAPTLELFRGLRAQKEVDAAEPVEDAAARAARLRQEALDNQGLPFFVPGDQGSGTTGVGFGPGRPF